MLTIKKIKPLFTTVITTMEVMDEKDSLIKGTNLIDPTKKKRSVKEFQTVIAVGPHVNGISVGDLVCINPARFGKPVQKKSATSIKDNMEEYHTEIEYRFDIIEVDGKPCMKLQDRDIDYVVEEFEEFDENPTLVTENTTKSPLIL